MVNKNFPHHHNHRHYESLFEVNQSQKDEEESNPCLIFSSQVNPTGGRITVVQGSLPNVGPGAVENREAGAGEKVWLHLLRVADHQSCNRTSEIRPSVIMIILSKPESDGDGEAVEPLDRLLQAACPRVQRPADRCGPLCYRQVENMLKL